MLLIYVRHGPPVYHPDNLTPLGERQAEAVARRLAVYGVDRVYSSSSVRAQRTAEPTCELLHKSPVLLDWLHEDLALAQLTRPHPTKPREWVFRLESYIRLFNSDEMVNLGHKWYTHPEIAGTSIEEGFLRIQGETDAFLKELGYEHDHENHNYRVLRENNDRIAVFAHEGVGKLFLSSVLDIPYPLYSTHFDMTHSAFTVIEFAGSEVSYPNVLTLSNDSHLYKQDLPLNYRNHNIFF